MDKNAIKKYAVWARRELIERVSQKALQYGIIADEKADTDADSVNGRLLSDTEKKQRQALIRKVNEHGYEQVMEEVAYTWFNRFAALRFMEVNGYLPSHVRVFTNDEGEFKPQILSEAIHLDLDGLDMDKVYELKNANKEEELFKYLLIVQCNALNNILPGMFQRIEDYTELLLPDYLLREGSAVQQMIELIPEDDWTDQVQIIGWLYQYYNTEPKDKVFADLKKNIKITKENIPAATQLFTPDWIVRYMVENSLGRLWIERNMAQDDHDIGHWEDNNRLHSSWKYYLDEAEQDRETDMQLRTLRTAYKKMSPEDIKFIDPCMGSGHILVYAFDVLMQIYETMGWTQRDAARSIVRNNLYGLDIDGRAAQLAYFAVMMKARGYDRRFLDRGIRPNLYKIEESNEITNDTIDYIANGDEKMKSELETIMRDMHDASQYGSIISVTPIDFEAVYNRIDEIFDDISIYKDEVIYKVLPVLRVAEAFAQKYDVVCTNPPYMGAGNMNPTLNTYIKNNYADYKSDFFSVFIVKCSEMAKPEGKLGFFSPYVWMFIQSYEKLRKLLCECKTIETLIQFEYSAFEEATVPVCTFVLSNSHIDKKGCYLRLTDFRGGMEVQRIKTLEAINNHHCGFYYEASASNFSKIPGSPVAYWVKDSIINVFSREKLICELAEVKIGMGTGKNEIFVRQWWEIVYPQIDFSLCDISELYNSNGKWFPYNKGGDYRLWYGNLQEVLWFDQQGREKMNTMSGHRENGGMNYYFKKGITWTFISSANFGVRQRPCGSLFDVAGSTLFTSEDNYNYLLAFLSSNVCNYILKMLNPTLNYQAGNIKSLPVVFGIKDQVGKLATDNVYISRTDWDAFETSWDFARHPLVPSTQKKHEQAENFGLISWHFDKWEQECENRFNQLKANEEELNRIFIDIYGLQDELTPEVEDKDVTVRKADLQRDIKSLISYAVGCMFGRYSLEKEGLIYAGGDWDKIFDKYNGTFDELGNYSFEELREYSMGDLSRQFYYLKNIEKPPFSCYPVDADNIIPICDDEYFSDDIVGLFVMFIEMVFGEKTLEENLKFIADTLGGRGTPREVIRSYFMNDFYADHCKIYQKRPIYWLFDSGKKNGFKCLVYMHRYQPDTIARIRTDYVHEQQSRYRTAIADLEERINGASTSERVKLNKRLSILQAQAAELREYEEKIHHLADQMIRIDLDDGVKHNYEIFKDVLAKIK